MKLIELLNKANKGYDDGFLGNYYDPETGEENPKGNGDGLAQFIVVELRETFNEKDNDLAQRMEAIRALESAIAQLENVVHALQWK
jgi:hypothetical protein